MNTVERLASYDAFNSEVIEQVADVMDQVRSYDTYDKLFKAAGMPEVKRFEHDGYHPVDVVDRRPKHHDPAAVLLDHLGIVNPLDPNNLVHVAAIGLLLPDARIVAAANPSGPGYKSALLNHAQRKMIVNGNTLPYAVPTMSYLDEDPQIEYVEQVAFSFGNERLLAVAKHVNLLVGNCVAVEPASDIERDVVALAKAAAATGDAMDGYVQDNELPLLEAALKKSVGKTSVTLGSLRLTNFAAGRQMARGEYQKNAEEALEVNPAMSLTSVWCSDSEYKHDDSMTATTKRLQAQFGGRRVYGIRIPSERHLMVNYLPIELASVLQGLNNPSSIDTN